MSLVIFITVPEDQARDLARTLVHERLAGSVNVLPGTFSVYCWEGEVSESAEALLLVKTTQERYSALEARVKELHPYEVPEILALKVEHELAQFGAWLENSVKS
jgi:periplasmic divalent cation tolerance protein